MKLEIIVPALILWLFVGLPGCRETGEKEQGPKTLATVNGVPIVNDDLYLQLGSHGDSSNLQERVLENLINEELLYQNGVKLGLDKDQKFQNAVRLLERRVVAYKRAEMTRRVRDTQIAAKVNVTDQDIKDYYDKHTEEIATELHLGVLQFSDESQAKEALDKIRTGTPFEKIAGEKFPHAPKGKSVWDRGYLQWNQIQAEMLDAVYRLKKGEVSDVLNTGKFGIYLVKVLDRRKNQHASLENMSTSIMNRLHSIKIAEAYDRYLEQLKKESRIKVVNRKRQSG